MRRVPSLVTVLAVTVVVSLCPRPVVAAAETAAAFDQFAQAWMGAVALLAHDGDGHDHADRGGDREHGDRGHGARGHSGGQWHGPRTPHHGGPADRCECGKEDCKQCRGGHGDHGRGEACHCGKPGCERCAHAGGRHAPAAMTHGRGGMVGPMVGPGPRTAVTGPHMVIAKMDEILARLARIEAKLDGRSGGMPRGEWRGPPSSSGGPGPRPEMPEHVRRMMEERMKAARERMREGGPRPEARPEVPAEMREQIRQRIDEGREKMEQARKAFREMEERIKRLEAELQRLKSDR